MKNIWWYRLIDFDYAIVAVDGYWKNIEFWQKGFALKVLTAHKNILSYKIIEKSFVEV